MVPLFKVFMPDNVSDGLNKILHSGQLSYGEHTKDFERKLRKYVGNENILTLSGNSIFFALKLINIQDGDEVIVSPMSCLMTTQPIKYAGAKVVWADIDPLTGSLDPLDVTKKITNRTKAIIHYHWAGNPGHIDEINEIANKNNIIVIEDATESFGAEYKGRKLGNNNSDIVCFSFTPVRLPNAIDGGGIALSSRDLYQKAVLMRDLGINRANFRDALGEISESCDIDNVGDSTAMNNISGYVGASQMPFIEELLTKQRENALRWEQYFKSYPGVRLMTKREYVRSSYWTFTILCENRDELLIKLRKKGIYASKVHLRNDLYSVFGNKTLGLEGVNEFSKKQLNLPCGWWITEEDYDF
ncbi:aminotransferase class V-fold PLP-dependent enzyme [Vibrio parahaemolyticus]|uniref:Aminotransferase class V-fold PLP-dependent enzyme n=3 Tax=Vibrio parahaemolyticus TaxID=670 RepID=A0A7Y0S981_VIBPH|nr:aminotransferase class V-fold PLP-dependent enzyme [Vibrio parahaemolyticus]ETZ08208.1 aminotransferase DegT [Vibrio parahaemolyticus M0605]AWG85236.1 aminotransferase DegT [Vibrio parahaemolyticus]AYO05733.1 aminotransferase class V-fold PLP-dependent enzyme [Vibrio parahaemolyticus]EGQ7794240.1 aminotransferase class V-fold PLP-dependent enzyme [Vibrio parahaemolyticus]EGQ7807930.1 aminotransferase class V-fold PLP-dependent enzyme [Vibrio parahaemolyticus]